MLPFLCNKDNLFAKKKKKKKKKRWHKMQKDDDDDVQLRNGQERRNDFHVPCEEEFGLRLRENKRENLSSSSDCILSVSSSL
jgi:hypothetical protein